MRFDFQPWEKVQKGRPPLQVRISEMMSWEELAILFENLTYRKDTSTNTDKNNLDVSC